MPSHNNTLHNYLSTANNIRKNLLRIYRKQKWQLPHFFLFPAVFIYSELLLRMFSESSFFSGILFLFLFGAGLGFFCSAVTSVFKRNINRILSLVILYLTALVFTTECLIRESYQVYMTFGDILFGAEGVMGGFAGELLSAIFFSIPKILLFFLPALLYTGTGKRRVPARRYPLAFAAVMLALALVISGIGTLGATAGKHSAKYKEQFNINSATNTFGLLTSLRLSAKYSLTDTGASTDYVIETHTPSPSPSPEASASVPTAPPVIFDDNVMELDFEALMESEDDEDILALHTYVNSLTPSKQNKYTGLFQGKNLILICAEAFSDAVIHEELTPTLYRMVHNGFYFSDYYQPSWGGSTSSGEFSFVTGLVPVDAVESIQNTRENNNYFTLGNQLQRLDYFSRCYHNGDYDYYDRHLTHENLGYDQFLGLGNGLEDIAGWWTDDEVMLRTTLETYMDSQPFSVYYMTISGHSAYTSDNELTEKYLSRVQEVLGDKYKATTNYYLCYQMALEDALTTMISMLEEAGIADDTVICMTSDHYPYGLSKASAYGNTESYVVDLYGHGCNYSWDLDHNTLIIWSGCLETEHKDLACEISTPTYSLDIVPTLSNLFGLEYDSRLLVGRDVFSDTDPLVLWRNFSWITERGKFDSDTSTFIPNEGYTDDPAYVERINQIVTNKIKFSGEVVYTDYYGELFGPDEN